MDFSENFALECAAGIEPPGDICARYSVPLEYYEALQRDDVFRKAVVDYQLALRASGKILQIKAQIIAEANLDYLVASLRSGDPKDQLAAWKTLQAFMPEQPKGTTAPIDPNRKSQIILGTVEDYEVDVEEDDPATRPIAGWMPGDE